MVTSYMEFASILNIKLGLLMPKPSTETTYIKMSVWDLLTKSKKDDYFGMQFDFASTHQAMRLNGINDAHLTLARAKDDASGSCLTIFEWLKRLVTSDGCFLFCKVSPCLNGEIEMWHHIMHANKAKAWLSTALAEIAHLS